MDQVSTNVTYSNVTQLNAIKDTLREQRELSH